MGYWYGMVLQYDVMLPVRFGPFGPSCPVCYVFPDQSEREELCLLLSMVFVANSDGLVNVRSTILKRLPKQMNTELDL
jgi:hypothetical protein